MEVERTDETGCHYCSMVLVPVSLGRGKDFQSSPNPRPREQLTAERNQVLASWSRNSLYKSQAVSPFWATWGQTLRF